MKNTSPLTIIIPTYNSESYISKTLDHLVKQNNHNFDVWIVDDNSTDKTDNVIAKYSKRLNLVLLHKPKSVHKGAAASINYAFNKVTSDYWALIDSDAFLHKNWVEEILTQLKSKQIVGAPVLACPGGDVTAFLIGLDIEVRYNKLKKEWLHHLSTCNIAGRKEILKYISLTEDLQYAYDHELSFQLKRNNVLFYLTRNTHCHHLNKSGAFGYFKQQYKIAKYHSLLAKKMKKEASEGDEISPISLLVQPLLLIFALGTLFFNTTIALIITLIILLPNFSYLGYVCKRKFQYLPLAILLIYIRNIAWITGSAEGLCRKEIK